jgi:hypothetical protein
MCEITSTSTAYVSGFDDTPRMLLMVFSCSFFSVMAQDTGGAARRR